ncbi:cellulose biosynthesis cyclic di-GMP-binding regulatory protein BcsB, partial [Oharaeibacter diazotrophicus]
LAPAAPAPAAPTSPGVGETLRRLPAVADGWTLSGEVDTVVWPLYLDGAAVARGGRLVFGIETAVSVMPEASTLVVQVNGRTVGQVALGGGDARRLVSLPIPPAALSAGWNAVRVTANQRHRVDCSVDGTYELWTRIDPAVTGFVAEGVRPVAGLDGLPALALDEDGRLPIRIRRGGALDTRALEPAVEIAGAL